MNGLRRASLGFCLGLCAVAAQAQDGPPLPDSDLDAARGGFATPLGFDIGFGAEVSTYVDGKLALQTRMTWTETGPVKTLVFGALTPDLAARAAQAGLKLQDGASGVLVDGQGGATAVLQDLDSKQIRSLVINNASDRDVRQDTAITLALPDFAAMQKDFQAARTQLRLDAAMGLALKGLSH